MVQTKDPIIWPPVKWGVSGAWMVVDDAEVRGVPLVAVSIRRTPVVVGLTGFEPATP